MGSSSSTYTALYAALTEMEKAAALVARASPDVTSRNQRLALAELCRGIGRRLIFTGDLLEIIDPADFAIPANQPPTQEKSK